MALLSYIRRNRKLVPQINKDEALCEMLNGNLPEGDTSLITLFKELDNTIKAEDANVKDGALNNAHGDWYEYLLGIASWNLFVSGDAANLALILPNIRQFDVATLYNEEFCNIIYDLREKIVASTDVELITSNPDFVIVSGDVVRQRVSEFEPITELTTENLNFISSLYQSFVNSCGFDDIIGYIGVKASLRPDRRLQLPHEGSLMKAIYVHLQTRNWIIDPKGLKYYAISRSINDSDRKALRTVATHSITTVHNEPQAAVDEVYAVDSLNSATDVLSRILN
ncbi:Cfr10I/Bse634I family restriction endonuclease [Carboxylicivirga sp. RSCT41]|uniref:Cfr10I/Bse634I family restriction endonuclease n=1 Tax=Carboxylicivirga agarovorans TaxID=3417570 RepID=UPI003D3548DF